VSATANITSTWDAGQAITAANKLIELMGKLGDRSKDTSNKTSLLGKAWNALGKIGWEIARGALREIGRQLLEIPGHMLELGKSSLHAASALEEMENKFNVVFKGMTDQALIWRDELVKSYLMSTREATAYLSAVQDMLKPMGMSAEAAGKMSFEIVKLATDLGSFNDLPTAEVMSNIQSAIVGQFEPMRKYGVVLNETRVKQEALNMGYEVGAGVLDPLVRAQAAYSLILKETKDAQGDAARSADSYANQLKKLNSRWEELLSVAGKYLLPVFADLYGLLSNMIENALPYVEEFSRWIADNFEDWANILKDTLLPGLIGVADYLKENDWSTVWGDMLTIMEEMLINFFVFTAETILKIGSTAIEGLGKIFDFVDEQAKGDWNNSWAAFWDGLFIKMANFLADVYNYALGSLERIINLHVTIMNKSYDLINEWSGKAAELFTSWINKLITLYNTKIGYLYGHQIDLLDEFHGTQLTHMNEFYFEGYLKHFDLQTEAMKNSHKDQLTFFEKWAQERIAQGKALSTNLLSNQKDTLWAAEARAKNNAKKMGEIGTEAGENQAEGMKEGFESVWNNELIPTFDNAFQGLEDTSYTAGLDSGSALADGYKEGFESGMSGWSTDWYGSSHAAGTGQAGSIQSVDWNGTTYYSWDGTKWFTGNYWDPKSYKKASQAFYDWYYGGQAYTGGMIDMFKGVIPSFQRGGEVPIIAHHEEVILPTEESGYDYEGYVSARGRVKQKGGNSGSGGVVEFHFHDVAMADPDGIRRLVKKVFPTMDQMVKQGEIHPKYMNQVLLKVK
jgi:hypothetical protein